MKKIESAKTDMKQTWKTINYIIGKGQKTIFAP